MAARQCSLATNSFTSASRKFCGSVTVASSPLTHSGCVLCGKRMRGKAGGLQAVSWAGFNQGAPSHFKGEPVASCHPQVNSRHPTVTKSFLSGLLKEGSGARELALMSQPRGAGEGVAPQPGLSHQRLYSSQMTHPLDHLLEANSNMSQG